MGIKSLYSGDCVDEVIDAYSTMVYRLAYARVRTRHDADDVFQNVFVSYILAGKVFQNEEHRKAWLIRVTINCCNRFLASTWLKRIVPINETLSYSFQMQEETELDRSLFRLSPQYRTVIHLFYYEELSIAQISSLMKTKPSTVRTWLTRARGKLRQHMETENDRNESCAIQEHE
jgi:RNA polymerase sigma-70 factor, ECF subfamily